MTGRKLFQFWFAWIFSLQISKKLNSETIKEKDSFEQEMNNFW